MKTRLLAGRYELGELLGQGGMAEVRRGRDTRIGRDVAIKLLRPELITDPAAQHRFRREAQSAAALTSPGVVAIYDTGEDKAGSVTTPYIVMEYVEGRTLREVLADDGKLPWQRSLQVAAAIALALEQAHRAGIIHRDVKPANVMVTPSGAVKVMDFGIAHTLADAEATRTQTSAVVGTAHYLSPEQARGEHVDARSDVYSLGCLLYELLTGSPPFVGDSPIAVAYQHVREDAVPPSQIEPEIPPAVDAIVLKALAKNPVNRYGSATEMREDLERALLGEPVLATPVLPNAGVAEATLPTTVLLRQPPRRSRRAAVYTLLALAALAVFVVALLLARHLIATTNTEVTCPSVTGDTLAEATSVLAGKGLRPGRVVEAYSSKPAGIVLASDPAGGFLVRKGDTIDLTVSRGIHYVSVPNVVGQQQQQATAALKSAGFVTGKVTQVDNAAPAGQVLSQTPVGGQSLPIGSTVALTVSSGKVPVPNVVGQQFATALAQLEQAGFDVTVQATSQTTTDQQAFAALYGAYPVTSQSPGGATTAPYGSTVTVTVDTPQPSQQPSPGTGQPSGQPSAAPTP